MTKQRSTRSKKHLHHALLAWYDEHGRDLPWRSKGGKKTDPYRVWLSEIMLQQTTVATVGPYYEAFLSRWPTLTELGAADLDEVLHAWQGLGYYSRARNLHRCARILCEAYGGSFPESEAELRTLPGIGPYTASAIAAIAFDQPHLPVDGNIERVLARLYAVDEPLPAAKPALRQLATKLESPNRPGDFAQALMDLGATVCTVRTPKCDSCPWQQACRGRARGNANDLPRRSPKKKRPQRHAVAYVMTSANGDLYIERRPEGGLLGGLMQVPLSPWLDQTPSMRDAHRYAPFNADWQPIPGVVDHGFTHFAVQFTIVSARARRRDPSKSTGFWCAPGALGDQALSTMIKKIVRHATDAGAIGAGEN